MKKTALFITKEEMTKTISGIADLPEEMVHEILFRLRIRPLFRSKCVSKLWNSIISNPKFGRRYIQRAQPSLSGMLYSQADFNYPNGGDLSDPPSTMVVNINDDDAPPSLYATAFSLRLPPYYIDASSNGLILTRPSAIETYASYESEGAIQTERELELCVSNPLTKQSVSLPIVIVNDPWAVGLATRPQGDDDVDNTAYKVVYVQITRHPPYPADATDFVKIDVYSSDTGKWTCKEGISCPASISRGPKGRAFTYKGILHCFDWNTRTIVTYDPYDNPDGFGSIKLPSGSGKKVMNSGVDLIRLGHEDLIEFGEIVDCGDYGWRLFVWRLVDYDKGEWCVEKRCQISPLWNEGLLRDCKLLVAPNPWNEEFFCGLFANGNNVTIHDLASSEDSLVDVFGLEGKRYNGNTQIVESLVPIVLSPWSSPFHGDAVRNSSSKAEFRATIPWFPSF